MTTASARPRRRPALDRVIATADRLFYSHGIHATGVDTIAEEANVSKASLYTYFRTKDELVADYVRRRSEGWQEHVRKQLEASDLDAPGRVGLVFDLLGEWFSSDGFNGCPFINAEAETTRDSLTHGVNVAHRAWVRGLFADLSAQAGADDPAAVSLRLSMLYDGAMVGAGTEPDLPWAAEAKRAALQVLA